MTPAGTRVTWFVLGVCVGVLLAVVGMAGIAEAASEEAGTEMVQSPGYPGSDAASAPGYGGNSVQVQAAIAASTRLTVEPTAALAGPLISGEATWCAPTATQCQSWGNGRLLGAVHSFRWGDEPYRVRVWRGSRSVTVSVVSFCACLNRPDTIDLSVAAFSRLAPLPLGRIPVEVEVLP